MILFLKIFTARGLKEGKEATNLTKEEHKLTNKQNVPLLPKSELAKKNDSGSVPENLPLQNRGKDAKYDIEWKYNTKKLDEIFNNCIEELKVEL